MGMIQPGLVVYVDYANGRNNALTDLKIWGSQGRMVALYCLQLRHEDCKMSLSSNCQNTNTDILSIIYSCHTFNATLMYPLLVVKIKCYFQDEELYISYFITDLQKKIYICITRSQDVCFYA
jgi:hypothetical protein